LQITGAALDGAHDAEEVAAVDLLDVVGGVALFEQRAGEGGELVVGAKVGGDAADAVEVGADADVIDAADADGVVDLGDDVGEGGGGDAGGGLGFELVDGGLAGDRVGDSAGFAELGTDGGHDGSGGVEVALREVGAVEVDLEGTAFRSEGADHVVGQVAGVAGDGAGGGVRGNDGGGGGFEGVVKSFVGGVGDVDHHAEAVHLVDDVFAEGGEAVVVVDFGVVDVALRIGPVVGVEVGKGHVADAERVEIAEEAEGVFDSVPAFDAHQGGDPAVVVGVDDSLGGGGEDEVFRVGLNDVGADGVDHLEGAVGGVIAVDVVGVDEDGEELCAEEAFHAGEVGLTLAVRIGDIVTVDGFRGDVVVGVDEDGIAGDAVYLGLGDRTRAGSAGLLSGEGGGESEECSGAEGSVDAHRCLSGAALTGLLHGGMRRGYSMPEDALAENDGCREGAELTIHSEAR